MDNPFANPTIISVGPGMLGLETGLEAVVGKPKVTTYVEIESFIIWNLVEKMEQGLLDPAPFWVDVKTYPFHNFYRKVHGLVAGYPCQPFSNAGQRKGEEDPRHLWPYLREGAKAAGFVWCFFENVAGHLTLGFDTVYKELSEMGYAVEAGLYTAEEVGANHQRKRLFILAIKKEWLEYAARWWSREHRNNSIKEKTGILEGPSNELGYTNGAESGRGPGETRSESQTTKGASRKQNREWLRDEPCHPGKELADTPQFGVQRRGAERFTLTAEDVEKTLSVSHSEGIWPAPPGYEQYEWEARRTQSSMGSTINGSNFKEDLLLSSMGSTINGYNFKEDLLRMLGNGVVSQCVEVAFPDLMNKHLKSYQLSK